MDSVNLQVAYGAVKHFGRNLYTANPPAIAEIVANSWDAYAENCFILERNGHLLIGDDGIGMTDEEFASRYAVSGTEKKNNEVRIPKNKRERPYMGRKGIGKFASFSLGEKYIIYTKSNEDIFWKKVTFCYENLLVDEAVIKLPVEHVDDLGQVSNLFGIEFTMSSGTLIYIPKMRRKFIKSTEDNLKKILSRRFSVNISKKFNFKLSVNNADVDLKSHFYDSFVEFIYYFNTSIDDIKIRFSHVEQENFFKVEDEFFNENKVSGWIGTVQKPKNLKVGDELNSTGIIVYINGKLADENILKSIQDARISNSYVIGEVNADFLQNEDEDPVLSSREGLNMEIEGVENLRDSLSYLRSDLINKWNELRASRDIKKQNYLLRMIENKKYCGVYQTFNSDQRKKVRKYAQKLFDNNEEVIDGEIDYFTPVIFSLVNSEIINNIDVREDDDYEVLLSKFYNLFDKTEINNALRIKSNIQDRLNVIEELKKHINDEAKEKIFEVHLEKHPWLINPYWDKDSHNIITRTQERYQVLIGENKINGISDIIIRVAEEPLPIICELKREKKTGYSTPNVQEIINQVLVYRKGILDTEERIGNNINGIDYNAVKAFFVCGEHLLEKFDIRDRNHLELTNNIKILTYQQIIRNAYGIYSKTMKDSITL
ncbi:ATP-binding protein [Enterococcus mundtii]|uniref:ATP-binding protein n=2 Tax=Enterococcus mundtii TaxID=53346 RepID=A0A242L1S9_ENTMU|nr:ATP-binding protein [Enterococcus mundtii]NBA62387.1 hypothetical protein [Enterococcus mundtii]OTP27562.1 hypothetical protein A5802_001297 [Enterococcus mundtii]